MYHRVRGITLINKRKLVQRSTGLGKGSLLDVGSGTGAFVHEMDRNGWNVAGLEPEEKARKVAKEKYLLELKEPKTLFEWKEESFDAITLWHVLEHVHSLHSYIEQLKMILRSNGRLFIAVPNYTSADAAHYRNYWAAYDVPRHLYHFSPDSMKKLMEIHGLKIVASKPMWYDSFYISLLSSRYKRGKSSLAGALFNGSWSNLRAIFNRNKCSSIIYVISK
jgi:cyclopropane fatty-acyl-phospholipid synthase-like methyltransferase